MIQRGNGPFAPHDHSWRTLSRRSFLKSTAGAAGLVAAGAALTPSIGLAAESMSFLTWCDHLDPRLIGGYEELTGIKVNGKSYEGTGSALALKDQSSPSGGGRDRRAVATPSAESNCLRRRSVKRVMSSYYDSTRKCIYVLLY